MAMEPTDLMPLIEQLGENIDDLEEVMAPLLQNKLLETAGRLPLLDKAQLYVLATFAIESLIFSYLRLNEVNAKEHPVFRELARVKQYFLKITEAENGGSKRTSVLDKPAAGRFIKHALAGNKANDNARAQQQQQAESKLPSHIKFNEAPGKRKHEGSEGSASNSESPVISATEALPSESPHLSNVSRPYKPDQATSAPEPLDVGSSAEPNKDDTAENSERRKKRRRMSRKEKREKRLIADQIS